MALALTVHSLWPPSSEKAEKEIRRLESKMGGAAEESTADAEEAPESKLAGSAEPTHTPAVGNGNVEGQSSPSAPVHLSPSSVRPSCPEGD